MTRPDAPFAPPAAADPRMTQRGAGVRTFFEFGEENLRHGVDDGTVSRTATVEYAELSSERERLVEQPTLWRLAAVVLLALGGLFTLTGSLEAGRLLPSPLLGLAVLAYGVAVRRVRRYVLLPAPRVDVRVIDDEGAPAILAEIDRRRAAQLRERFDYLSPDETPEQQRHRVLWLQRQGSLDDHEVSARLLQIDLLAQIPSSDPRREERD